MDKFPRTANEFAFAVAFTVSEVCVSLYLCSHLWLFVFGLSSGM